MGQFNEVIALLKQISADHTVPRNIRTAVDNVMVTLDGEDTVEVKISSAISTLDEVSNDPNIPMYTRTQVWNIVSMLEHLRSALDRPGK